MKKINLLRTFSLSLIFAATTFAFVSCDNDDDVDESSYTLSGSASGTQEVPAVTTTSTGTLSGSYNSRTNTLNYTINWTGLSGPAAAIHFHGPAMVGVNAGVIHPLTITANGISGTASGSLVVADTTEAHLLGGKVYYNIHTALNPNGEIRGQVTATAD